MTEPELLFGPSEGSAGGTRASERAIQAQAGRAEAELAMNYCPRCSARLAARSCKMICPGCGYYMSCSDFY